MSFSSLSQQLSPYLDAPRWLVAYSGGVDSHVLLHCLSQYPNHPPIEAIHINHQLQLESDSWVEHCQQQADTLGIVLHRVAVAVDQSGSLEENARLARYKAFESMLKPGDILMMGHHQDDQVETLMLRLLRGSGSRGAAAMPASRPLGDGTILRPLLDTPRSSIEQYAKAQELQWIEDPSNDSTAFDRNFLRLELLPAMASRWPEYRRTLTRAASLNAESAALNNELAQLDFERGAVLPGDRSLPLTVLQPLSEPRQKNVLRYWLTENGFSLPSVSQLQVLLDQALNAEQQSQPLIRWAAVEVRRFNGALYVMSPLTEFDSSQVYHWNLSEPLAMSGNNQLVASVQQGKGIKQDLLNPEDITVRFRQGGERCQPAGRGHSQSLKKLFQEYSLELWLRDRTPLIYSGEEIVAVADLWVCDGWEAKPDEPGLALHWQY